MSDITNVILTFSIGEDRNKFDKAVEKYFSETDRQKERLLCCNSMNFPSYTLEASVYVGAFNYFNLEEFLLWLCTFPWREEENVQVFVQKQEDAVFWLISLSEYGYISFRKEQ